MPTNAARKPRLDTAAMAARYEAGETLRQIADALGCSIALVHRRLKAAGVGRRPTGPAPTAIDVVELEALYLSGLTTHEVAARVGVAQHTVHRRLARRGTPMRRPGVRPRASA